MRREILQIILIKLTLLFSISSLLSCCTFSNHPLSSSSTNKKPTQTIQITDSFVKIQKIFTIKSCIPVKNSVCHRGNVYSSSGSGVVIASNKSGSFIITAGHVCTGSAGILPQAPFVGDVEEDIILQDIEGKSYSGNRIIKIELKRDIDLCAIFSSKMTNHAIANISDKAPNVGDRVINVAAPAGIFHPPAVPILEGIYSGIMKPMNTDMYTVPAVGGSSGSPIYNQDHKLIGIVFAAHKQFSHMSMSTTYKKTMKFILDSLAQKTTPYKRKKENKFIDVFLNH